MTRGKELDAGPAGDTGLAAREAADRKQREHLEAEDSILDRSVVSGQVVQTPDTELPYKAVLDHADGTQSECAFRTSREAEAFIKRRMPRTAPRDRSRDRPAGAA